MGGGAAIVVHVRLSEAEVDGLVADRDKITCSSSFGAEDRRLEMPPFIFTFWFSDPNFLLQPLCRASARVHVESSARAVAASASEQHSTIVV